VLHWKVEHFIEHFFNNSLFYFKKLKHTTFCFLGASLRGCNFEDPAGSRANMEGDSALNFNSKKFFNPNVFECALGVNMKGAVLEESNMAGVNLRVGTLKYANLQNCTLR
jgi:uncharacterized protein YjbI with pentapeptide repeats